MTFIRCILFWESFNLKSVEDFSANLGQYIDLEITWCPKSYIFQLLFAKVNSEVVVYIGCLLSS